MVETGLKWQNSWGKEMEKILIVEDDRFYQDRMLRALVQFMPHTIFKTVDKYSKIKNIIENNEKFDLVIADMYLSDSQGEHIKELTNAGYKVIVITGLEDEAIRDEMFAQNIVDYIFKSELYRFEYLIKSIERLSANKTKTILIIEDSKAVRIFYRKVLENQNLRILEAKDGNEAVMIMSREKIDMILSDYSMPNMDGIEFLKELRKDYSMVELPFIAVSAYDDQAIIARFLRFGANDYLRKPFGKEELIYRINNTLDTIDMIKHISESATKDALTGMHNRHYLYEIGKKVLAQSKRYKHSLSLAIFDIDFFKKINDTYGHMAGDIVLKSFSYILIHRVREADIAVRYGGEEFIVIFPETDIKRCFLIIESILQSVREMKVEIEDGKKISITTSAGIAEYNYKESLDDLIKRADSALYLAKKRGRNRVEMVEE